MIDSALSNRQSWYVIQSKPKQEFRALEQLQNQGFSCYLPTLQKQQIRRGKPTACVEPLFSRYLFIQLDTVTSNWSPIRSTRGVSNLVAFGGRFAILPDACVDALKNMPRDLPQPLYTPGERIEITSGPFAGLEGIYQAPDGEARAMVLLELMNQAQKLVFGMEMLRRVV